MNRLKELRVKAGLSQAKLGEAIGTTRQNISLMELNERSITANYMHKLALFFGVSADFLMGWDDTGNYIPQMYMSFKEAQNYLGFESPASFREYIHQGLPVVVVGKSKRIGKADLAEFIEKHKVIEHE